MKMRHQLLLSFAAPFFAILFSGLALIGCGGGGSSGAAAPSPAVTKTAILSGAQEVPTPIYSGATGTGFVTVDPTTRAITGTVTFSGFTATAAHIHVAPAGSAPANNIVFGLTLGANSATVPSGIILTEAQYADLLAGNWYFNVHSAANPTGEIRGQIGVDVHSAMLSSAQELNSANTSIATGTGFVTVDPTTRAMTGTVTFSGFTATAAHIHVAPAGSAPANNIVFGLTLGANSATVPSGIILTEAQYADLLAGNWYFNVHSAANPAGEIRGQIGRIVRVATLDGTQEVPSVITTASGSGIVSVHPVTRAITGTVTFSGVTATAAHIHVAPAGSAPANNIVFGLTLGTNSAVVPSGIILTEAQYADLLAGNWYFNVHSAANPAGEIRGQINKL